MHTVPNMPATETTPLLRSPEAATAVGINEPDVSLKVSRQVLLSSEEDRQAVEIGFSRSDDEESTSGNSNSSDIVKTTDPRILQIVLVMILAVFVHNADSTLVIATHPAIASEFGALEASSWLFTAFGLAGAATQVTFGKLSEIYGRKHTILFCYAVFTFGCTIIGTATSLTGVIVGRVICGSVGAGMGLLVSILLTDVVPIRQVATWRSYINVAATAGRSIGGPLGGWLADVVGWRWSFLGQAPLFMLAFALCWFYLPSTHGRSKASRSEYTTVSNNGEQKRSFRDQLAKLDIPGTILLAISILSLMLPLQIGGSLLPWDSEWIPTLFVSSAIFGVLFVICEARWAKSPLLPLILFKNREAMASYIILGLQAAAQIGLMFTIPLYFQVTDKVSNTEAGARMVPSILGNTVGSIMCGIIIQRTGRYKKLVYAATLSGALCYLVLIFTWHRHASLLETLYIIPGGFGNGVAQSSVFIGLQAVVESEHLAPALSTLYLSTAIFPIGGVAACSAVLKLGLKQRLADNLLKLGLSSHERNKIMSHALSNMDYIYNTKGEISEAIVDAYILGIEYSHALSFVLCMIGFFLVALLRDRCL